MAYNTRLTKEELIKSGITEVTEDGRIFKNGEEITPSKNAVSGYYHVFIYVLDENGNKIKVPRPEVKHYFKTKDGLIKTSTCTTSYTYKIKGPTVQRVVYAWFNGEVPEGYVVDHINNIRTDNRLSNLQLLSPKDNINKGKQFHVTLLKCKLTKDRSFYEEKLKKYTELYEEAKLDKDREAAHKWRSYVSQYEAKLRYYDLNKEDK